MTVLLDTNVVLDFLVAREPFAEASAKLFDACDKGRLTGFVCASAVTDLFYIIRKATGDAERARAVVREICQALQVAPVNRAVLSEALDAPLRDFEDALAVAAARAVNADAVVTRDPAGFRGSALPVHAPAEIVLMRAL